jgi:glycosyltransferase involved in cell wall biosynthesis
MISVFTPTPDPKYLKDCYDSLRSQTYKDWEWIILDNANPHSVDVRDFSSFDFPDTRVHVHKADVRGVGDAKYLAVSHCHGDLLVELDHDDILTPHCLKYLADGYAAHPDSSLFYSNTAQINEDESANLDTFNLDHGWEYRMTGDLLECLSMEPYPHNISYIWYAPNHVRAFTRAAYDASGGYDRSLLIADDQDLMCRLYQVGPFTHIPKLLYYQRIHPNMSQKLHNAEIQTKTVELYDRYIEDLALCWADREGLDAIELGAAHNSVGKSYLTADLHGDVDLKGDVFEILNDYEDSSVGVIRAVDFLEHVPAKIHLFNEFYRVLAHGGMLLTLTPSTDGRGAFQDPTHVSYYNSNSFWYFTDPEYSKYVPSIRARFQVSKLDNIFPSDFHQLHNIPYVQANLIAIKNGPRQGGILHW